jgi:hypothetical protein
MAKTTTRRASTRRTKFSVNGSQASAAPASGTFRSTIASAESVGANALGVMMVTVASALRGMREVGGEVGTTAVMTVRGSLRAAEVIGGDVARLASGAATGALDAADRIGAAAARAVRDIVAEAAGHARPAPRKPLRKARVRTTGKDRNEAVA